MVEGITGRKPSVETKPWLKDPSRGVLLKTEEIPQFPFATILCYLLQGDQRQRQKILGVGSLLAYRCIYATSVALGVFVGPGVFTLGALSAYATKLEKIPSP